MTMIIFRAIFEKNLQNDYYPTIVTYTRCGSIVQKLTIEHRTMRDRPRKFFQLFPMHPLKHYHHLLITHRNYLSAVA